MLTSRQIRQQFLDFFVQRHGHALVPSSPVVPHNDPTLLFTNAGMNQFKPYFLGTAQSPYPRVANTQKCIRAGGKHNDLDDVGRSRRHHTFFEMLGNWSFGNYFKKGAIEMAWELLTGVWGLDPRRLHVSCYEGDAAHGIPRDDEAADFWRTIAGVPDDHIHYFGKDNFWEMGDTGPCGPCTEIHVDRTPDFSGGALVNGDDPRVMEIWNLVFIQYNRDAQGRLTPLPAQHVDTGMGFERICQVLQDKQDNFGIDLWEPLFGHIGKLSGARYTGQFTATNSVDPAAEAAHPQLRTDIAFRVVADHARCLTFALTDGADPSNEGRGYVLRRILRRAVRFGRQQLGLDRPFLHELVPTVLDSMADTFPELRKNPQRVMDLVKDEEVSFGRTLDRGIELFEEAAGRAGAGRRIAAADAFKLHDTYGFPLDLTQVMAGERGMTVDAAGFEQLMEQARDLARSGGAEGAADPRASLVEVVQQAKLPATTFVGYTTLTHRAKLLALYAADGATFVAAKSLRRRRLAAVVTDATPFYAEAGGQVGDTGVIRAASGAVFTVSDTIRVGDVSFHLGQLETGNVEDDHWDIARETAVELVVDEDRRRKVMANHTSTHLMNHKLRAVLGEHVQQKGSLVDEGRTRFDFAHGQALSDEQIQRVQELVNADIAADLPVHADQAPQEQALKIHGLRAVFGEKYPPVVRVVSIGPTLTELLAEPANPAWMERSIEFCGGTHLASTGAAQRFVVVAEEAVAKGVRRITAQTGELARQTEALAQALAARAAALAGAGGSAEQFSAAVGELVAALSQATLPVPARSALREALAELQRAVKEQQKQASKAAAGSAVEAARQIAESSDGQVVVAEIPGADGDALRAAMDVIRKKRPEAALLLGGAAGDKVAFVAAVPKALIDKGLKAGDWVKEAAKVAGGGGGGRPDMAQAGGKDPAKLAEALDAARKFAAARA